MQSSIITTRRIIKAKQNRIYSPVSVALNAQRMAAARKNNLCVQFHADSTFFFSLNFDFRQFSLVRFISSRVLSFTQLSLFPLLSISDSIMKLQQRREYHSYPTKCHHSNFSNTAGKSRTYL